MITTLDVETTFHVGETKRTDPTPFHPKNRLVSVQYNTCDNLDPQFVWFYHEKKSPDLPVAHSQVQQILNKTTLLVGHNIKFDLVWLWEREIRCWINSCCQGFDRNSESMHPFCMGWN